MKSRNSSKLLLALLLGIMLPPNHQVAADCLANSEFNQFFVELNGNVSIPTVNSCCQFDVCGLECPVAVADPASGMKQVRTILYACFAVPVPYFRCKQQNFNLPTYLRT
jgi:hypothetical protein